MDEQSRRDFLSRYATLALSVIAATGAGEILISQEEPPVAVYGPPPGPVPSPAPSPRPPAPVYGPPPRDHDLRPAPRVLYGPPPGGPKRLLPTPGDPG
jgi:hypothetical protein